MKSVLLSVRPQHVANILNKIKTLEIRKRFPSDYVGWVYIYCTKEQGLARLYNGRWNDTFVCEKDITDNEFKRMYSGYDGKGKVVARFWCDKVEEIKWDYESPALSKYITQDLDEWELCNKSCLTGKEMVEYLVKENKGKVIHITKLEIFDKPKELYKFKVAKPFVYTNGTKGTIYYPLTRAPQSWCYIEV